jgi:hypothetical protein
MTRLILLALTLLASPASAEKYCNCLLTTNNVCIGSESNVPPVIIRCNYEGSNSDSRCVGVGRADSHSVDPPRPKSRAPR